MRGTKVRCEVRAATDEKNIPVASQFETFTGNFHKACNGNFPVKKNGRHYMERLPWVEEVIVIGNW